MFSLIISPATSFFSENKGLVGSHPPLPAMVYLIALYIKELKNEKQQY